MVDFSKLMTKAALLRKRLGEDNESPIDIFAVAQNIDDLTIVFYPMGDNISGMCLKCEKSNLVAINTNMTLGRQRFTLAHEFFHLYFDKNIKTVCAKTIGRGSTIEREADIFASFFLMPSVAIINKVTEIYKKKQKDDLSICDIIRIEQCFGVSHQATLIRMQQEGLLSLDKVNEYFDCPVRHIAESMGYDSRLYKSRLLEEQYKTFGHYISRAKEVWDNGLISDGKYEELLLNAFRSDLVYGDAEDGGTDVID